jgi:5-methylcytosine-specific restriction endonuclease McrA
MSAQTVLLNADYTFLNVVNWKRAIKLEVKGKVEVLEYTSMIVRNAERTVEKFIPKVMKLVEFVKTIYKHKVPFSRKNVLVRDGFKCMFCGTKSEKLTIDHLVPKSKGGKSTFGNCVAACKKCNSTKGNKRLEDTGMHLIKKPHSPTVMEFLQLRLKKFNVEDIIKGTMGICNFKD